MTGHGYTQMEQIYNKTKICVEPLFAVCIGIPSLLLRSVMLLSYLFSFYGIDDTLVTEICSLEVQIMKPDEIQFTCTEK